MYHHVKKLMYTVNTDRAGNHRLPLTQDLLGQMLGTRRASVTLAAGIFQKAGFI